MCKLTKIILVLFCCATVHAADFAEIRKLAADRAQATTQKNLDSDWSLALENVHREMRMSDDTVEIARLNGISAWMEGDHQKAFNNWTRFLVLQESQRLNFADTTAIGQEWEKLHNEMRPFEQPPDMEPLQLADFPDVSDQPKRARKRSRANGGRASGEAERKSRKKTKPVADASRVIKAAKRAKSDGHIEEAQKLYRIAAELQPASVDVAREKAEVDDMMR